MNDFGFLNTGSDRNFYRLNHRYGVMPELKTKIIYPIMAVSFVIISIKPEFDTIIQIVVSPAIIYQAIVLHLDPEINIIRIPQCIPLYITVQRRCIVFFTIDIMVHYM
jgi:hypothetical protein